MSRIYKLTRIGFYALAIGAFSWMASLVVSEKKDAGKYSQISPLLPGVNVAHADIPFTGNPGDGDGGGGGDS